MASSSSSLTSSEYPELFRERPFVYVVHAESATQHCHYCLKGIPMGTVAELSRCQGCQFAHYCDRQCQKAAWADHKEECKCLKKLGSVPATNVRLAARIFFKRDQPFVPDDRLPAQLQQRRLDHLISHLDDHMNVPRTRADFEKFWNYLKDYVGDSIPLSKALALDMDGKLMTNAYNIGTALHPDYAKGLYLGISALDHSCDPDAFRYFDGVDMVVGELKPGVAANKTPAELTVSYVNGNLRTTAERRTLLAKTFFFQCNCPTCLDPNRDAEMRSMRCQKCSSSVPVHEETDEQKTAAKCPSCGHENDAAEALRLMKAMKQTMARMDSTECEVAGEAGISAGDDLQFSFFEFCQAVKKASPEAAKDDLKLSMALLAKAEKLLAPENVYTARLAIVLLRDSAATSSEQQQIKLCQLGIPAALRFTSADPGEKLLDMMTLGLRHTRSGDRKTVKEGIELLRQAIPLLERFNERSYADRCRTAVEAASAIETKKTKLKKK